MASGWFLCMPYVELTFLLASAETRAEEGDEDVKFSQFVVVYSCLKRFGSQVCRNVLVENYIQNLFSVSDIQVHTEGRKKEIKLTWKFILEQWCNNQPKMT